MCNNNKSKFSHKILYCLIKIELKYIFKCTKCTCLVPPNRLTTFDAYKEHHLPFFFVSKHMGACSCTPPVTNSALFVVVMNIDIFEQILN